VTVTPPHAGKGILMVETDHMLYVQDIDAKPGSTFKSRSPRTGSGTTSTSPRWCSVAAVRRARSPRRAVGVVHVPMDRKGRTVAVGLVAPKQMRRSRTCR
jgi:uncharacterized protein YfaS (alpha-2-macroglobulin family)